jgi:UDP-3-O-[3-hydroxymyristoyl] glucosamine N-acyltransferase
VVVAGPEPGGLSLGEITEKLGGELIGDAATRIVAIAPLDAAGPGSIAFLANPRYRAQLSASAAACVIVGPGDRELAASRGAAIVAPDPYLYFARLTQMWAERHRATEPAGIHPTATIDPSVDVGDRVSIGPFVVIEAGAVLAEGVAVGAGSFVGRGCRLGAGTRIGPRVTLLFGTRIGARCIVHPGAVLGADGFGFAPDRGRWEKIEQLGDVVVGDDVEIGANSCIDRGAVGDTVIGDGVKIDNLVQIAHNVRIGAHTAIAGCVGIAGSTEIGAHCMIGGHAGVAGHLRIADRVVISGATQVTRSITKPGMYSGVFPFEENAAWEKNAATLRQLHTLRARIRELEKKAP